MNLMKNSIVIVIMITFSYVFIVIGPAYVLIFDSKYVIPTGNILPFVDPDDLRGYLTHMILQAICCMVGFSSMISSEVTMCMINNTCTVMTDLLVFNITNFSDNLRQGVFSHQNKAEFRKLQDLDAYFDQVNDIHYWKFFLQPIMTTGCVSLAIFAKLKVHIFTYSELPITPNYSMKFKIDFFSRINRMIG